LPAAILFVRIERQLTQGTVVEAQVEHRRSNVYPIFPLTPALRGRAQCLHGTPTVRSRKASVCV
jgi:hypothetical protein